MRHFKLRSRAGIALLLAALVLLLDAMAASPSLHELIHKDAGQAEHQCGVTLFAHGMVDSAAADVPVIAATASIAITPQTVFSLFHPAIENLPAGRAPPVLPVIS